jgi:hypothetical protein
MCCVYVGPHSHFTVPTLNTVALAREWTMPNERPPMSAKLVPAFKDRWCHVVSATDPYGRILGVLDRLYNSYSFPIAHYNYTIIKYILNVFEQIIAE